MSDTERQAKDAASTGTGYRVLARKYRPKDFTDLMVGQEPMVRTLTNAFETGRIAQAYMLTGVRGVGKTTTARILARALNYRTPEIDRPTIDLREPGEHCQAIMEGRHVDVIEMDAASHTGIDDIREIIEQVRYRPVSARYKVYIIDEVHMLSTAAFNGLLKTLEEPPEHVKFIFATTEIRKVPITVLSRCQRFDLRRISASDLVGLFTTIAGKEGIEAEPEALAMIARAAEGSARDGLSLLDQAIAHGSGVVVADAVRSMLGLADRARIVDLFHHIIKGDVAAALAEFNSQYEAGANPVVVLTDLADFTHLVTRLKYVPDAANDPSLSEVERNKAAEFAQGVAVTTLSRIWQMLLKGIPETESAARTAGAAEMVLIRLAHAAHLPAPEDAARRLAEFSDGNGNGGVRPSPSGHGNGGGTQVSYQGNVMARAVETAPPRPTPQAPVAMLRAVPNTQPDSAPVGRIEQKPVEAPKPLIAINSMTDIAELAGQKRDPKLKAMVRSFVRPVRLEPGRLDVSLTPGAPGTLLNELAVKLKEWTGIHWIVSLSRDEGEPTVVEAEANAQRQRVADARQDPDVAAILSQFPGAKIIDVRVRAPDVEEEEQVAAPAAAESDEGDILPGDDIEF
ncbi:DNA polymerase III subunit gamma/tau [Agrobacterium sp. SHOUNA12C]|uniref:DNA polymerase III subunit gamma/tau n=1 Tax=Rhizobium rhizogenes NBRC 13257 TaxID=1220581 RepID=A0AA87Q784_RHIRH|nr:MULTISPECIES: DNA polymerase III subunit gamma/tau [Rhizobium]KAA6475534.1 DNA polymerase III subunit gamma/tau [Agrobacterium sp. ICMP 7243]MCJ9725381.1 DNA polymerase III subunit gamma/tau [Agrobacterium sp. BETTINA12B]MCJ9761248.1 DNA polymerase III subunit gamma/tau [Agrobacterium sp. SHOUNA12C]OCJ03466.1 DNA polymerase III subunit gamma/tau [Agrobacterium sp. 13-626]OCJ23327.1 DNA polymerase III subunit gamma/tau [Agrobacterium sp. B131/95]